MRFAIVCSIAISSFAALPLPVHYDPFLKAKVIIEHAKKTPFPTVKRKIVLNAIFDGKAFIDGRFYRKGERVDGYQIVAIKEGYVVLRKGNGVRILPLYRRKVLKVRER